MTIKSEHLIGRTIVDVGYTPSPSGMGYREWNECLLLDDGTRVTALQDEEGNGDGCLIFIKGSAELNEDGEEDQFYVMGGEYPE